jgi:hypothetical protein
MSISPKWKFWLIDTIAMKRIGELTVPDRTLNLTHNAAGTASYRMSMDHKLAANVWPYTSGVEARRWSPKTKLWSTKWTGYTSDIDERYGEDMMNVTVVGWMQWLEERILRVNKDYTSNNPDTGTPWKDWEIIRDIIVYANRDSIPVPGQADYVVPTLFADPSATAGSPAAAARYPLPIQWGGVIGDFSTHERKGWPADRGTQLLEIVKRLCDIENGCDVRVDPLSRKLYVYDKKMSVQRDCQFGFRTGSRNLSDFNRKVDTSNSKNYFEAIGPSNIVPAYADTKGFPNPVVDRNSGMPALGENSMAHYGLMEDATNVTDAKNATVLQTYAAQEVFYNSTARLLYDLTPLPYTLPEDGKPSNVPEPFEEFEVGDQVFVSAKRPPRINISKQGMRTFNMNVSIDNSSNSETLGSLQVNAS